MLEYAECTCSLTWNFDWQRSYLDDEPVGSLPLVDAGDGIDVACTCDNTLRNPFVQRALPRASDRRPARRADLDEMCLGIFGVVVPLPPAARANDDDAVRAIVAQTATAMAAR